MFRGIIIMNSTFRYSLPAAALFVATLGFTATTSAEELQVQHPVEGGICERNVLNCADTPNPLPEVDTVWLEDMTWMDVRDAMAAGKKTVIIPTGGIEANGPWVVLAKHDYILKTTCDVIARELGNALCGPVISFVDQGNRVSPGTVSVSEETYEALIADLARTFRSEGFEHIIFISDNGGPNQEGQAKVAEMLNEEWDEPVAHYIPEYYESWTDADAVFLEKGLTQEGVSDGLHDDPSVTTLLMVNNPQWVRWLERVAIAETSINGVSIADKKQAIEWGHKLAAVRAKPTVEAIRKAIADGSMTSDRLN